MIETIAPEASPRSPDPRSFFGFAEIPFTREIAVSERWTAPHLEEVATDLLRTIDQRMSATLIAPVGSGKTVVIRTVMAHLPEARYQAHYIKVTSPSKRDFCRELTMAAGVSPAGSYPALVRRLQEKFELAEGEGRRPVLLVDEAQELRPDALAVLRIIQNFQMDSRLVLSLVLAGQPTLSKILKCDELEAVSRRMAHLATIRLLSRTETRKYMEHRIRVVGGRTFPFDEPSVEAVFEISRGNFRAIDELSRKALEIAAQNGVTVIDPAIIAAARQRLLP
jgi:general secretion pathway protein A